MARGAGQALPRALAPRQPTHAAGPVPHYTQSHSPGRAGSGAADSGGDTWGSRPVGKRKASRRLTARSPDQSGKGAQAGLRGLPAEAAAPAAAGCALAVRWPAPPAQTAACCC